MPSLQQAARAGKMDMERAWWAIKTIHYDGKRAMPDENHIEQFVKEQSLHNKSPREVDIEMTEADRKKKAVEKRADRTSAEAFADELARPTLVALHEDDGCTQLSADLAKLTGTQSPYVQGADLDG